MKAIELTDQQQDQLIEMANKLFPNRDWHISQFEYFTAINGILGHNTYTSPLNRKKYSATEMHWLEFMVYHLIPKLTKKYGINIAVTIPREEQNIVDVIYEQYKIQKNKEIPKTRRTK